MFNSQRINNDPEPYRYTTRGGIVKRASRQEHVLPAYSERDPHPEYDNNPNPILVEFREAEAPGKVYRWLDLLEGPTDWSEEHVEHATKVLTRLVNIFGTEET